MIYSIFLEFWKLWVSSETTATADGLGCSHLVFKLQGPGIQDLGSTIDG